jgi:hypothetical protein
LPADGSFKNKRIGVGYYNPIRAQFIVGEKKMRKKRRALVEFKVVGSFLLLILMVACVGRLTTYNGSWVADENRISLQDGGPHKGNWQTRDMTIEFTYQQKPQNLEISGVVKLGEYLTNGFSTLDYLILDIYTLDADGIVLNSELMLNFGYHRDLDLIGEMTFDNQLALPADTAAIAFGYRGRVSEGGGPISKSGGGDRIAWEFWKIPGRKPSE